MTEALMKTESGDLDFSDKAVQQAVKEAIRSKSVESFPQAFQRLIQLIDSDNEVVVLNSIRLLAQLGGMVLNKSQVDVKVTFDDLRQRKSDDPLSSLFDVGSPVIEGEVEE